MNRTPLLLVNTASVEGRGMRIALDYDGTVTEDEDSWELFVRLFQNAGHEIRIVTFRSYEDLTQDLEDFATRNNLAVMFTAREAKQAFCKQLGWEPDVWIDDTPSLIVNPSEWTTKQLTDWKASVGLSKSVKEAIQGE